MNIIITYFTNITNIPFYNKVLKSYFVNKADIGASSMGEWIIRNTSLETVVSNPPKVYYKPVYSKTVDCREIAFEPTEFGTYLFKEIEPPDGYELATPVSQNIILKTVVVGTTKITELSGPLTFKNFKTKKITLKKVDNAGNPLDGAVFEVYYNEEYQGEKITEGGQIVIDKAQSGTYIFKEIKAPKGYTLPKVITHTLSIPKDTTKDSYELILKNYKNKTVKLIKRDGQNEPLAGATFEVYLDAKKIAKETTKNC